LLIGISIIELGALALSGNRQKGLRYVSAAAGLVAMFFMFETGEHGGELVYSYAGGVGIRTGEKEDVERLLLAGLYHQAQRDRDAGRSEDAANLIRELERRFPNDSSVRLVAVESMLRDSKNPVGALTALDSIQPPKTSRSLYLNAAILRADALNATGQRDSARAVLNSLTSDFPTSARLRAKLDSLR
jgi:predicted Zn-dependent protease